MSKHFEMKNVHVKSEISFLMNYNEILFLLMKCKMKTSQKINKLLTK